MLLQTDISCDWEIKVCGWRFLKIVSKVFQKEKFQSFERIALEDFSKLHFQMAPKSHINSSTFSDAQILYILCEWGK